MQTPRQRGPSSRAHSKRKSSNLAATTSRTGLDALALTDMHRWLVIDRCSAHPLLDLPGHGQECLLDVRSALRRCLKERDSKTVSEFLEAQDI